MPSARVQLTYKHLFEVIQGLFIMANNTNRGTHTVGFSVTCDMMCLRNKHELMATTGITDKCDNPPSLPVACVIGLAQ